MKRSGEATRLAIMHVLDKAERPLTSEEISKRLIGSFGISVNSISVGVNLGYLKIGEKVKSVKCLKSMLNLGYKTVAQTQLYWYSAVHHKQFGWEFKRRKQLENYNRWQSKLPLEKRRRKRPISDDMRQMIEDLW